MVLRLNDSLGFLVSRAHRVLFNRLSRTFSRAGFDVTPEQWGLLSLLWNRNGQTQRELCQALGKDKATITRLVHGLEKRSLVVRVPSESDQRTKQIHLTYRGRELREELVPLVEDCLALAQAGIADRNLAACKNVLRQVIFNLEPVEANPEPK